MMQLGQTHDLDCNNSFVTLQGYCSPRVTQVHEKAGTGKHCFIVQKIPANVHRHPKSTSSYKSLICVI